MNFISEKGVIRHFGIKGMHWGRRKSALKSWGKEAGTLIKNNNLHPIITSKANAQSIKSESSIKSKARRLMLYQNTENLRDVNQRVNKLLSEKANKKIKEFDNTDSDTMRMQASMLDKQGKNREARNLRVQASLKDLLDE